MFKDTKLLTISLSALLTGLTATPVAADAPCNELDECRVIIEINATDGDIGFHVLFDAEGWRQATITSADGEKIFKEAVSDSLRDQLMTENFFESTEPVCEEELAEEEGDEVVTLPEFLARFAAGFYNFRVKLEDGGELAGSTILTHNIPAAPADVEFDGSEISWSYGDDLGECTTLPEMFTPASEGEIVGYEVVLEPDDDAWSAFTFSIRVPPAVNSVTVPSEYLAALPADLPLKVEVGAIEQRPNGSFGNQTFSEEDGFCNNADQELCPEEKEEEEE
ncbi:MAG: hypothetical protein R3175_09005 [Marinobacter sp.]|uniref:hypothetical protein n=1 Tax=Marinobacter sp. TaxID=50741 RepID=UPI00299E2EEE|nr:hypothetical protein [Marinobacter sp.]MDX1756182.1 hypothetical protein [Marinobacter sp.]